MTESNTQQQPDIIFICGPSWRCGSTLIQRILNNHPQILIYGEDNNLIKFGRVLYQHSRAGEKHGQAQTEQFKNNSDCWQANLAPAPEIYLHSYAKFLSNVLLSPDRANQAGRNIWDQQYVGIKSLCNSPAELQFIKWLLPSSKIIFCVRNYGDSLRSYMRQEWGTLPHREFYHVWVQAMECLDVAAGCLDLIIEYESEPDAHKLTEQLQKLLPRVTLNIDIVKKVMAKKLVFEENAPINHSLPKWTQYL